MGATPDDNTRLEPAVRSAMSLRGEAHALVQGKKTRKQKRPSIRNGCQYTLEQYSADLEEEIEDNYLIGDEETRIILWKLAEAYGERYSQEDLIRAIRLVNELNYCALMTQSSLGDGDEAISELEKQVPGFSRGLYADLIGYTAYVNR